MKSWKTINGYEIRKVLSGRSNVFLVSGEGKNILVDTSAGRLWKKLRRRLKNLDVNSIDYLILTHSHYDHAANASKIKSEFNAKVIVHETEAVFLEKGENAPCRGTICLTAFITGILAKTFFSKMHFKPCIPDIIAGESINMSDNRINVLIIHTPGHTTGSQSILVDNEIALVGDTMFGILRGSIFPPFAQDVKELVNSWGKLLKTGCRLYMPSHGTEDSRELVAIEYERRSVK